MTDPSRLLVMREDRRGQADFIEEAPYEFEGASDTDFQAEPDGAMPAQPRQSELPTLEHAERTLILTALERFEGNRRQTAESLGISERTLYRKLKDIEAAESTSA